MDEIKGGQGRDADEVRYAGLIFLVPIIAGVAIAILCMHGCLRQLTH